MLDISFYVSKDKCICPFCNKTIKVSSKTECLGPGYYDIVYSVSCDCTSSSISPVSLGVYYDIKSLFIYNEDINIIIAYLIYKNKINELKERFIQYEN